MLIPHIGTVPYYIPEDEILEEISVKFNLGILHPVEPNHYNFSYKTWFSLDLVSSSPSIFGEFQIYSNKHHAESDFRFFSIFILFSFPLLTYFLR